VELAELRRVEQEREWVRRDLETVAADRADWREKAIMAMSVEKQLREENVRLQAQLEQLREDHAKLQSSALEGDRQLGDLEYEDTVLRSRLLLSPQPSRFDVN
jgi:hypothetical protein